MTRYLAIDRSLVLPGQYREMFPLGPRRVVITMESGTPRFTILDESFTLVPPPTLDAPVLALERYSATAAVLTWNDVQGELSYSVERRVAGTGTWAAIASVPFDRLRHVDTTLVSGAVYEYRIRAANGYRFRWPEGPHRFRPHWIDFDRGLL